MMYREGFEVHFAGDWLRRQWLIPEEGLMIPDKRQPNSSLAEGAVCVITVHRSKGLKLPVVICPTLWAGVSGRRSRQLAPHRWHPKGQDAPRLAHPRWAARLLRADRQARG